MSVGDADSGGVVGGELPGEVESLFFCIQTGIGVGIIAFVMGRSWNGKNGQKQSNHLPVKGFLES